MFWLMVGLWFVTSEKNINSGRLLNILGEKTNRHNKFQYHHKLVLNYQNVFSINILQF